jgi:hypothetical protein
MPEIGGARYRSREEWVCRVLESGASLYAHAIGIPGKVELESAKSPEHVDHLWLNLDVPPCGNVLLSINTLSRVNRNGGFDPRVNVGLVHTSYAGTPGPFLEECTGLDYAIIEAQFHPRFEYYEHERLAALLIARTRAAVRIEVWGELYRRGHLGLHQIHSRRASCAVSTDLIGHDGALRFYLPEGKAEMFLFKYCGQP